MDPRVRVLIETEGRLQQRRQRLRPGHFLKEFHPLVVLVPSYHLGNSQATRLELLGKEHRPRVLECRLDDADDVEGIRRGVPIEEVEGGQGKRRQWLIERKALLEVCDNAVVQSSGSGTGGS